MINRPEQLLAFLENVAREHDGSIPFERFMHEALFHPDFGYYTANISTVGRRGDFSTAATLSGALAAGIAHWIRRRADELGFDEDVPVIELGAGDGSLAELVLREASWWGRRRWNYRIVEISPRLREVQRSRLRRFGKAVSWAGSVEEAIDRSGGRSLVFSNELVDAFPVIVAAWDGEGWQEVRVEFDRSSGLREVFEPLDSRALTSTALQKSWAVGQRIEIHDSYRRWLPNLTEIESGAVLTIDYGGSAAEIYDRRPGGSLRGYFRQQPVRGAGIYQRFGRQDLTADVNFDDVRAWGEEVGLGAVSEATQAEWLATWAGNCWREDAMADLEGAGGAFRVLEQQPA